MRGISFSPSPNLPEPPQNIHRGVKYELEGNKRKSCEMASREPTDYGSRDTVSDLDTPAALLTSFCSELKDLAGFVKETLTSKWYWIIVLAAITENIYVLFAISVADLIGVNPWLTISILPIALIIVLLYVKYKDEKRIYLQMITPQKTPDFEKAIEEYAKNRKPKP